jgi:hypothetical protein
MEVGQSSTHPFWTNKNFGTEIIQTTGYGKSSFTGQGAAGRHNATTENSLWERAFPKSKSKVWLPSEELKATMMCGSI